MEFSENYQLYFAIKPEYPGAYRLSDAMLNKIQFLQDDILILLGDVIDRGPDGIALLMEIMEMPNVIMLLGNHEYMMLQYLSPSAAGTEIRRWNKNGNAPTLAAYHQHLIRSPRNYLIGYKSDDGSFGIHEIHYDSDTRNIVAVERKPQLPTSSFAISCCLPPKVSNRSQEYINKVTCCITSSRMHDELIQKVGAVIGEISQIDESVNSNVLVESLY